MTYFNVKIQYTSEDEKGKTKKTSEQILVDALSCTEAEGKTIKHLEKEGETREYEIKGVQESKIVEVLN